MRHVPALANDTRPEDMFTLHTLVLLKNAMVPVPAEVVAMSVGGVSTRVYELLYELVAIVSVRLVEANDVVNERIEPVVVPNPFTPTTLK